MTSTLQGRSGGWEKSPRKQESWTEKWVRRARQLIPKFLRRSDKSRAKREPRQVDQVTQKLWGGHTAYAADALRSLLASESADRQERIEAALQLARLRTVAGEYRDALELIDRMRKLSDGAELPRTARLMEVDLRLRLNNVKHARQLIAEAAQAHGYDADFSLLAANVAAHSEGGAVSLATDEVRLEHINRVYEAYGLLPLKKIDPDLPLTIDNIACEVPPDGYVQAGPKISVIMPAHNASGTIAFALASVAGQTWRNIEILVVDDASADDTREIVAGHAKFDSRITLIPLKENLGVYNARNQGLAYATGDYVTVHDADDWSHAQKLEAQIEHIRRNGVVGCFSRWVRVSRDLQFSSSWRPMDALCSLNLSSLMLPMRTARELGGWDPVRVGADHEFAERVGSKFGSKQFPAILKTVPLAFALSQEGSLTRNAATHVRTFHFGLRKDYRRAYARWHQTAARSGDFSVDPDPRGIRKFPAPVTILPIEPKAVRFDAILAGDFAETGPSLDFALASIRCGLDFGRRIGIFHWPRADRDIARDIVPEIAALVDGFRIEAIEIGRRVGTRALVIFDEAVLREPIDAVPGIRFENLSIVSLAGAPRENVNDDDAAPQDRSQRNLERLFGAAGERISPDTLSIYSESMLAGLRGAVDPDDAMLREKLLHEADAALTRGPYSVIDKPTPGPSGEVHDYWTIGPYWWPNPESPDGRPYVHKDGERSPGTMLYEAGSERYDRTRLQRFMDDTTVLALAAFVADRQDYARHAAALVRRWFLDPASRMTPHLAFAQMVPGRKASARGIIEAKDFYFLVDALRLLYRIGALDTGEVAALRAWFREYLNWLLDSDLGADERKAHNNHGTYYDLQVAAIAVYLGDFPELFRTLSRARTRIPEQFAPDGSQPREQARSMPLHYYCFNLLGWLHLAAIGERWGQDLWTCEPDNGRDIGRALRWLVAHFSAPLWPGQEVAKFTPDRLWPIYYACLNRFGTPELNGAHAPPAFLAVRPLFHPFDGMEPFWMLGRAFSAPAQAPARQVDRQLT